MRATVARLLSGHSIGSRPVRGELEESIRGINGGDDHIRCVFSITKVTNWAVGSTDSDCRRNGSHPHSRRSRTLRVRINGQLAQSGRKGSSFVSFASPAEIFGMDGMIVLIVVVVVLFGSTQIPKLARSLGSAQKEFKEGSGEKSDVAQVAIGTPPVVVVGQPLSPMGNSAGRDSD